MRLRAATVLASSHAVYGVTHLAALARLLPERDPHQDIYELLERTLDDFDDVGEAAIHLVKFELAMLAELGFGLDLENCAATGETSELIYVSPKSGGAVSRAAGDPWRDRLLRLPAFLREGGGGSNGWSDQDLQDGFRLTGMFLLRHVLEPRGQGHSDARDGFINAVTKHRARVALTACHARERLAVFLRLRSRFFVMLRERVRWVASVRQPAMRSGSIRRCGVGIWSTPVVRTRR